MNTQNQQIVIEVEGLVLESQILSFEDKKKLLYKVSTYSPEQLEKLKEVFARERTERKRIAALELDAWNGLRAHLQQLVTPQQPQQ